MLRAEPKLDRSAHAAGDPVPTRHALGAGADSWIAAYGWHHKSRIIG